MTRNYSQLIPVLSLTAILFVSARGGAVDPSWPRGKRRLDAVASMASAGVKVLLPSQGMPAPQSGKPGVAAGAVRYAEQFPGTDFGDKLANACAALPPGGGTIDATRIRGAQTISNEDIFAKCASIPVTLLLGATSITCTGKSGAPGSSACISPRSHDKIIGSGRNVSLIRAANGTPDWIRLIDPTPATTDLEFANFEIDGNKANITGLKVQNHGIMLNDSDGVSIHDMYIHDTNGDGITVWGGGLKQQGYTSNFDIEHNYIKNVQRAGVAIISGNRGKISDNRFDQYLNFESIHSEPDGSNQYVLDLTVTNNLIHGGGGIAIGGRAYDDNPHFRGATVTGNTLVNAGHLLVIDLPYSTVDGNTITDAPRTSYALDVETHDTTVVRNTVQFVNSEPPPNLEAGIVVYCTDKRVPKAGIGKNYVIDNTIRNSRHSGIEVFDCNDDVISLNTIDHVQPSSGSKMAIGILVRGEPIAGVKSRNIITSNRIIDTFAVPTLTDGIYLEPGSTNTIVAYNTTADRAAKVVTLNGSTNLIIGNGQSIDDLRVTAQSTFADFLHARGADVFCSDCKNARDGVTPGSVCEKGGSGAPANREGDVWKCF